MALSKLQASTPYAASQTKTPSQPDSSASTACASCSGAVPPGRIIPNLMDPFLSRIGSMPEGLLVETSWRRWMPRRVTGTETGRCRMTQTAERGIGDLRAAVGGPVFTPGDDGYDDARRVWNAEIDRRPGVVVRCASVDDVRAALAFAVDTGLEVSVRGGAHNASGS